MNGLSPLGRLPSFHVKSTCKNIAVQASAKGTSGRCCMISLLFVIYTTECEDFRNYVEWIDFNPLSKKHEISFSDLRDEPIILLNPDSIETKLLMERFSQAGVIPNIIFYSDQVYTIQHSINHEIASSFLYDIIVPRNHEIIMIPLECPVVLHISLIWKKDRYVHSGVQKIIKLAKSFKFEHYHG